MTVIRERWARYLLIIACAAAGALNYELFVFPNNFAPAGLNGFLTIIRHLTGFGFGYMNLILNIPLLIAASRALKKHFVVYTFVYVAVFSLSSLLFRDLNVVRFAFVAKDGGEKVMASVAAGVFNGAFYSIPLRLGASTGGIDIIAALINHKRPELSLVWLIFLINILVALVSFFAYGNDYVAVILCIIYSYVTTRISDSILKGSRTAAKFEVITTQPDKLSQELMEKLRHGCTVVPAKGMYSHSDKSLLICVVNNLQIADFERVIDKYEDTFVIVSSVNRTYGNFKKIK